MFRNIKSALLLSLVFWGVAAAQPQTVSYYSGPCTNPGSCDIATVPAQGFVLTDVLYGGSSGQMTVREVVGQNDVDKAVLPVSDSSRPSYQLNSGIPFSGGSTIRVITNVSVVEPMRITLVGYIPGTTASGSVPAIGSLGLGIMLLGMLGAGGLILRRASLRREAVSQ